MSSLHMLEEGVGIAVDALRTNKLRSGLTIMGVAVGVSVVVLVAALITGIRSTLVDAIEVAGPENFQVARFNFSDVQVGDGNRSPLRNRPIITVDELERVATLPAVKEALYGFNFGATVEYEGTRLTGVPGNAYSSGWPAYQQGGFAAGRDFHDYEVRESRPVIVLSTGLAEYVFGSLDPIGRKVRLNSGRRAVSEAFTVVGVYEPADNLFNTAIPRWFILPYTSALKRLKESDFQAQILVVPEEGVGGEVAQDQVVSALRAMRGLGPREDNNFRLQESAQVIEIFDRFTGVFFIVILGLSSVGLLVGGIGVIGIMMISVTERTREIGIRKATGATPREIRWQFLVEAVFLTVTGGAVGMALGGGAAWLIAALTPVPAKIPLWSVAAALGMAAFTGIVFGMFPAYRASNLDPVEALRAEIN